MPRLFTSAEIAEKALRQIGSLSVYDTAADASSFEETLDRLDLLVAEVTGTYHLWWFVPATQQISLVAGQKAYSLDSLLDDSLQFIEHVFLLRNTKQDELTQIRRSTYDQYTQEEMGGSTPEWVYIERNDNPNLYLLPEPLAGDELLITGQKYSDNLTVDGGQVPHGFPAAWQRALILQLAADIGSGPVTKLPKTELDDLKRDAGTAFRRLDAFNNRENVRRARRTRPQEF